MCYTASGSADAYWQPEIHPWDIAAGTLLVKEAGGKVSDFSGKDIDLSGNTSIIAGNPLIYDIMMKVIGS
jgi:myo-inositol-1(or 4)-monophosphatase